MQQSEKISTKWDSVKIKYPKPKILFGLYHNRPYITSSDNSSIFFFMSNKGRVYGTAKNNCEIVKFEDIDVYLIADGTLQQLSCQKPYRDIDFFVRDKIIPIFFKEY